jgi:two-component system response regulator LytT
LTYPSLIKLISKVRPQSQIEGPVLRVSSAIEYLQANPAPDLIFMDIRLADGLSFEIFQQTRVTSPVVFCTAFDENALEAFKANGVDYILKPFTEGSIIATFEKLGRIGTSFDNGADTSALVSKLLKSSVVPGGKQSFFVFKHGKYITISTSNIAYIFVRNEQCTIVPFTNEMYEIDQSLEETTGQLDEKFFFKLNRQYLIAFKAIKEVEY